MADSDLPNFKPITLVGVFLLARPAIDLTSTGDHDLPELRVDFVMNSFSL
jgi:hypothetical protein